MEALPAIIAADSVSLCIADMTVSGDQYANRVCCCTAMSVNPFEWIENGKSLPESTGILISRTLQGETMKKRRKR